MAVVRITKGVGAQRGIVPVGAIVSDYTAETISFLEYHGAAEVIQGGTPATWLAEGTRITSRTPLADAEAAALAAEKEAAAADAKAVAAERVVADAKAGKATK